MYRTVVVKTNDTCCEEHQARMTSTSEEQLESDRRLALQLQREIDREKMIQFDEKERKMDIDKDLKKGGRKLPRPSRSAIFLRCNIGDNQSEVAVFIDTGASHSFISEQMVRRI